MASVRVILCLAVVALFAFVQMGNGLECLKCEITKCEKETTAKETCQTGDDWRCLQILNDGEVYERRCGKEKECTLYADCSTCKEDKCNSSPVTMPSFLIIGVAGLALAKYFY